MGAFSGRERFTLADGKLTVTTERGIATGSDGSHMMRFSGIMEDGTQYPAQLAPSH